MPSWIHPKWYTSTRRFRDELTLTAELSVITNGLEIDYTNRDKSSSFLFCPYLDQTVSSTMVSIIRGSVYVGTIFTSFSSISKIWLLLHQHVLFYKITNFVETLRHMYSLFYNEYLYKRLFCTLSSSVHVRQVQVLNQQGKLMTKF